MDCFLYQCFPGKYSSSDSKLWKCNGKDGRTFQNVACSTYSYRQFVSVHICNYRWITWWVAFIKMHAGHEEFPLPIILSTATDVLHAKIKIKKMLHPTILEDPDIFFLTGSFGSLRGQIGVILCFLMPLMVAPLKWLDPPAGWQEFLLDPTIVTWWSALLCRLRSISAHRDHFDQRLSVRPSVRLSGSHSLW